MNKVHLSDKIKGLRTTRKFTLTVMAERLGVTASTVSAYENGTRQPSYDVLIKIANLFNVTVDSLLGNNERDYIDVSGLTLKQRDLVMEQVLLFKNMNKAINTAICVNGQNGIEPLKLYLDEDTSSLLNEINSYRNRD